MLPRPSCKRLRHVSSVLLAAPVTTIDTAGNGCCSSRLSTQRQAEAVSSAPSSVTLTCNLNTPGKRWGSIVIPWSDDKGAWANKLVPVCIINGGRAAVGGSCEVHEGSDYCGSALLCAGNHGDEYEGQIALHKFCRTVVASDVYGRLIVVPTLSVDAALAGKRTWPDSDRTNFNRRFPGLYDIAIYDRHIYVCIWHIQTYIYVACLYA